jgi:hypothetical protein
MAPVFYELDGIGLEQISGVPTELNAKLLAGEVDVAPISSIVYARNADRLRLLPRLCVSTEGAVDSIQLITRKPIEQVRSVAVTPESATSVVLTRVLLGEVELVPLDQPGGQCLDQRASAVAVRQQYSGEHRNPSKSLIGQKGENVSGYRNPTYCTSSSTSIPNRSRTRAFSSPMRSRRSRAVPDPAL